MTVDIVPYRPLYLGQVARLQTALWSPDRAVNTAYFNWKYERNPVDGAPPVFLALDGDEVVGMRGFSPSMWRFGGDGPAEAVLLAGDTVVAPGHRRRGLVHELTREALAVLEDSRYQWLLNLSSGQATFRSYRALGWRVIGPLGQARRCPQPPRLIALARSALGRLRAKQPVFARMDRFTDRADRQVRIDRAPRPRAMTELANRLPARERFAQVRDEAWFAWRFRNPLSEYRFLYFGEDRLEGYLVLQSSAVRRSRRVHILGWEASSAPVFALLLEAAIARGAFPDLIVWAAAADAEERRVLDGLGFCSAPAGHQDGYELPSALLRPVRLATGEEGAWAMQRRDPLDAAHWDFPMLSSDGY